jgi:hypothetical protein
MKAFKTLVPLFSLAIIALWPATASAQLGFKGEHYNLNIIGHENCPGGTMTDSNRHTIHVDLTFHDATPKDWTSTASLDKTNKIFLQQGDFQVIDGNACDGNGAKFQLPVNANTCLDDDPLTPVNEALDCDDSDFTTYQVLARALGSPKKFDFDNDGDVESPSAIMTTCGIDNDTSQFICSTENVVLIREKGKSNWDNVTKELTSLCVNLVADPLNACDTRVDLFEAPFEGFFWDYDNFGLRLAQLRFYKLPD